MDARNSHDVDAESSITGKVLVSEPETGSIEPYLDVLRSVGLEVIVARDTEVVNMDDVAGVLLTGGTDVNPALYGQAPLAETETPDDDRDRFESFVLHEAIARDMPVFAICRGMQLMNVALKGTLHQHVNNHQHRTGGTPVHSVQVVPGTQFATLTQASEIPVNSRHHQIVDQLGEGLAPTAYDSTHGYVEGLELPAATFIQAVQWHPENMRDDATQMGLFRAFAANVQRYAQRLHAN